MVIKKYIAKTIEEAKKAIASELGPTAEILTVQTKKSSGLLGLFSTQKIEVTATVSEEDLRAHSGLGTKRSQPRQPRGEGYNSNLKELQRSMARAVPERKRPPVRKSEGTYGDPRLRGKVEVRSDSGESENQKLLNELRSEAKKDEGDKGDFLRATRGLLDKFKEGAEQEPRAKPKRPIEVKEEKVSAPSASAEEIRDIIREEIRQAGQSVQSAPNLSERPVGSTAFLVQKGVLPSVAHEMETKLKKEFGEVDLNKRTQMRVNWINRLKKEIAAKIQTSGPILLGPPLPAVYAIVGPTGIGKTTTLVKIAAEYSSKLGKRVGIVSLDDKVGAQDQIKKLTSQYQIPLAVAGTGYELRSAVESFSDRHLVLIDTGGKSQYRWEEIDKLSDTLSCVDNCKNLLGISATTKDVDMIGTVQEFSRIGIDSLVLTKMDETISMGAVVNLCVKTGLSVRYLTNGQQIPGDLVIADASEISRQILVMHNSSNFNQLRKMALA